LLNLNESFVGLDYYTSVRTEVQNGRFFKGSPCWIKKQQFIKHGSMAGGSKRACAYFLESELN
jgi:hypothetical protein